MIPIRMSARSIDDEIFRFRSEICATHERDANEEINKIINRFIDRGDKWIGRRLKMAEFVLQHLKTEMNDK